MSFCRFAWNGSDVYVYESDRGFECCGCKLSEESFVCDTQDEMISHLAGHKRAGHFVPFYAIESLWEDIPGPETAVNPEPESLTEARRTMNRVKQEVIADLASEFSHL